MVASPMPIFCSTFPSSKYCKALPTINFLHLSGGSSAYLRLRWNQSLISDEVIRKISAILFWLIQTAIFGPKTDIGNLFWILGWSAAIYFEPRITSRLFMRISLFLTVKWSTQVLSYLIKQFRRPLSEHRQAVNSLEHETFYGLPYLSKNRPDS